MKPIRIIAVSGAAIIALATALTAYGHAFLESSTPQANGAIPAGATMLALQFSESIDTRWARVSLIGPRQNTLGSETIPVPGEPRLVRFRTDPLEPGPYQLRWRVLSVDGDITQGGFPFTVSDSETRDIAAAEEVVAPAPWEPEPGDLRQRIGTGLLSAVMIGCFLMVTGAALFWLEVQRVSRLPSRHSKTLILLAAGAGFGAVGGLVNLSMRLNSTVVDALATTAGRLLVAMAGLALLQMGLSVWVRVRQGPVRTQLGILIAVGVFALLTNNIAGHAIAGDDFSSARGDLLLLANALHLGAVAVWVGGVIALVISARDTSGPQLSQLMYRFSPWAIGSVVLLAISGVIMAADSLEHPAALWREDYGRLIALKSMGLAVLLWFGARHRYSLGPQAATGSRGILRAQRSLGAEALVMAGVVFLAGVLAVSPRPAAPVDLLSRPPAGQIRELSFGDYTGRLLLPDPLAVRPEQSLWLELRSKTFANLEGAPAKLTFQLPDDPGFGDHEVALHSIAPGRWKARGALFPTEGVWQVTIDVDGPRGMAQSTIAVTIGPAQSDWQ